MSILRNCVVFSLWLTFLIFFGYPSLVAYLKYDTFFLEHEKKLSKEDLPFISINKVVAWEYDDVYRSCYKEDHFERTKDCILNSSNSLNETLKGARENIYFGANKSIKEGSWKTTFTINQYGRNYELHNYDLHDKDYMKLIFPDSTNIFVEFYDKRYTVEKSDLFKDFPRLSLNLMKGQRIALYLDITQYILLPQVSNCVEDQNYSFMKCTRTWVSKSIGCRHFLDPYSDPSIRLCNNSQDLSALQEAMMNLIYMDKEIIETETGCRKNCKYYRYTKFHEFIAQDEEMIKLNEIWLEIIAASSKVTVMEETLVFPFRTFVAEFGGTLGLFIGFSFMMAWDNIVSNITFVRSYISNRI